MSDHTPPPWRDCDNDDCTHPEVHDKNFGAVRVISHVDYLHALHCVNAHDKLLAVLTKAVNGGCTWHSGADLVAAERLIEEIL